MGGSSHFSGPGLIKRQMKATSSEHHYYESVTIYFRLEKYIFACFYFELCLYFVANLRILVAIEEVEGYIEEEGRIART